MFEEYFLASFCPVEGLYPNSEFSQFYDTGSPPVFFDWNLYWYTEICSFCIDMKFDNLCIGIGNRKVFWGSFLWSISQVLLRWHSLSRRHRKYISIPENLRLIPYCIFIEYMINNTWKLSFSFPDELTGFIYFSYTYWTIFV